MKKGPVDPEKFGRIKVSELSMEMRNELENAMLKIEPDITIRSNTRLSRLMSIYRNSTPRDKKRICKTMKKLEEEVRVMSARGLVRRTTKAGKRVASSAAEVVRAGKRGLAAINRAIMTKGDAKALLKFRIRLISEFKQGKIAIKIDKYLLFRTKDLGEYVYIGGDGKQYIIDVRAITPSENSKVLHSIRISNKTDVKVREHLAKLAVIDPSPEIREAASSALRSSGP